LQFRYAECLDRRADALEFEVEGVMWAIRPRLFLGGVYVAFGLSWFVEGGVDFDSGERHV
jgi:hypothetical protein